jgi:hypothetical protein
MWVNSVVVNETFIMKHHVESMEGLNGKQL